MNFRINRLKIYISFFFPAVIVLFVISDSMGLIPMFLLSVLLHELTHLIFMALFDFKIKRIELTALGINIKCENLGKFWWQEVVLNLSAPIFNLILAYVFYGKNPIFSAINLVLGVMNLLPIGNLDGGNTLSLIIINMAECENKYDLIRVVKLFFGVIISAAVGYFCFKGIMNISFLFAALYMTFLSWEV